ncbi:MAG TPA: alpha/beta hydrolase [Gaiellaceae bacterium]|nr:alpha/beta hydrolase [Gaiellaceae bacterium]
MSEGAVTTPDGRTLTYADRGAPDGVPVIVCHGTPGSRSARHPDPEIYARHGVRAVAYDRPGYGGSDPNIGRSVADAVPDIAALADGLGFERFAVVGGSGGAPHALACGALLGDRVFRVGAFVTPAPPDAENFDFFEGLADINVREFSAALEGREAIEAFLQPYVDGIRDDPDGVIEGMLDELPEIDRELASRPEYRAIMLESFVESVRQGSRGWADDDLAFAKPWGFDLEAVTVETRLWQGELDVLTPRPHGEYVAARLPNAEFEVLEGNGHFLDKQWPAILDWLAAGAPAAA